MATTAKPIHRAKLRIKKGDTVIVVTGKDAGKRGKVQQVLPKENRVVVEGVNMVKRHTRPNPKVMQGGIVEKASPIHVSNVMIWCDKCGAPRRVQYKLVEKGNETVKMRVCHKCGESFDK